MGRSWVAMRKKLRKKTGPWSTAGPLLVEAVETMIEFDVALGDFRLYGTGAEGMEVARKCLQNGGGKWFDTVAAFVASQHTDRVPPWDARGVSPEMDEMLEDTLLSGPAAPKVRRRGVGRAAAPLSFHLLRAARRARLFPD